MAKNSRITQKQIDQLLQLVTDGSRARYVARWGVVEWRNGKPVAQKRRKDMEGPKWQPVRAVYPECAKDAVLGASAIRAHVMGRGCYAASSPRQTRYIVIDIDRHVRTDGELTPIEKLCLPELDRLRDARARSILAWFQARGCEPVIASSPGGGYHIYARLSAKRDRDAIRRALRQHLEEALARDGLAWEQIDLFPSGNCVRLPCGTGQYLLDHDLKPVEGTYQDTKAGRRRRIEPMVSRFLTAMKKATLLVRHLEIRAPVACKSERAHRGKPQRGRLRYGAEYRAHVQALHQYGIPAVGYRNDAAISLAWHHYVACGRSAEETRRAITNWIAELPHQSKSSDLLGECLREVSGQIARWDAAIERGEIYRNSANLTPLDPHKTTPREARREELAVWLARVPDAWRCEAERLLAVLPDAGEVALSCRRLRLICGARRVTAGNCRISAAVQAREALVRAGLLRKTRNHRKGVHGSVYAVCWNSEKKKFQHPAQRCDVVISSGRLCPSTELRATSTLSGGEAGPRSGPALPRETEPRSGSQESFVFCSVGDNSAEPEATFLEGGCASAVQESASSFYVALSATVGSEEGAQLDGAPSGLVDSEGISGVEALTRDHAADCLCAVCGRRHAVLSMALVEIRRTERISDLARDHGDACMCAICGPRKLGLDPALVGFT